MQMKQSQFVAVKCKLSKGLFSSERAFEVDLADGKKYSGPAPTHFCWNAKGKPLGPGEATEGEADGWVAARKLPMSLDADLVVVEVPDGAALAVRARQVRDAWTEITPPSLPATA
jgi:hypothetical protein